MEYDLRPDALAGHGLLLSQKGQEREPKILPAGNFDGHCSLRRGHGICPAPKAVEVGHENMGSTIHLRNVRHHLRGADDLEMLLVLGGV